MRKTKINKRNKLGQFTSEGLLNNKHSQTHGKSYTKLYSAWHRIKDRCYNLNTDHAPYYHDRGIRVCDEWLDDFMNFYNWAINNGYKKGLTIDRIDVNGNYEPSNCRWVTQREQANNRRITLKVECNGTIKSLSEWANDKNLPYHVVYKRYKKGWNIDKLLNTPLYKNKSHPIVGEENMLREFPEGLRR